MAKIQDRKKQHIEIVLGKEVQPTCSSFDEYDLPYLCFPEIDLKEVDTSTEFMGYKLSFPFIVSPMTGGQLYGRTINQNIAGACEELKVAFGMGSMRIIKDHPEAVESFDVKKFAPSVPVFGNLGLVQLNYGFTLDDILRIKDRLKLDGMFFHINPLQEIIQPEGDTNYSNLIEKLAKIIEKVDFPVIIKEVGHGISKDMIMKLKEIGVAWIDVSGRGGTSWAMVEGYRREGGESLSEENLGNVFKNFGWKTVEIIEESRNIEGVSLIAGGGIRNGLHIAKAIALGASMTTAARPILEVAMQSQNEVKNLLLNFNEGLKIAMFLTGSKNLQDLRKVDVKKTHHE